MSEPYYNPKLFCVCSVIRNFITFTVPFKDSHMYPRNFAILRSRTSLFSNYTIVKSFPLNHFYRPWNRTGPRKLLNWKLVNCILNWHSILVKVKLIKLRSTYISLLKAIVYIFLTIFISWFDCSDCLKMG